MPPTIADTQRMHAHFPSQQDRIAYLIGKNTDGRHHNISSAVSYNAPFVYTCGSKVSRASSGAHLRHEWDFFKPYHDDMAQFCTMTQSDGHKYVVQFGDRPCLAYGFVKSRWIHTQFGILLPLNTRRHWTFKIIGNEPPWSTKRDQIVWRGVTTGNGLRKRFVHALADTHNVRFSGVVQHKKDWVQKPAHRGRSLSRQQMLQYKYILSLPGNDVATNLKWIMQQNSVAVMPTPRVEGFLMEGLLRPFVHYVPLDDPRNISRVLHWLRTHDRECQQIAKNANDWMRHTLHFSHVLEQLFEYGRDQSWGQAVAGPLPPSDENFQR